MTNPCYIRWFDSLTLSDVPLVGGKNASLGELYCQLRDQGVRVPNGFAITADAYWDMLSASGADNALRDLLEGLDKTDVERLSHCGREARRLVFEAPFPAQLEHQILGAYHTLLEEYGPDTTVAVRSSATAEDLPTASFAGQQESYLNVTGDGMLIDMCRRCFASLFTDRAISYRMDQGFDHFSVALSVGVQKMVRADLATSGVMFTLDTESGFRDVVFITGAYGLGENVVQGAVDPDEYYVHKPTFKLGHRAVLRHVLGNKRIKMVYAADRTRAGIRNIPTPKPEQKQFCLSDDEVLTLADYAIQVEEHYSHLAGQERPMDMEWAKDGLDGHLYILQARPETVRVQLDHLQLESYQLRGEAALLIAGRAVGTRIASGTARVIPDVSHLHEFQQGEVLITDSTTPDWEPVMKMAAAIVTNRGGRTCHAAIVARELGIPAVVGTEEGTEVVAPGKDVTVSCAGGEEGRVLDGKVPYEVVRTDLSAMVRPKTRIMVNLGNPNMAFKHAQLPCDGVGLARMEFIINEQIGIHPMALLRPGQIRDEEVRARILARAEGHAPASRFFVQRLSEGIGTLCAAFYPRPVIVRLSDFKSNEYANLLGGATFEPREENPMLGLRGAARYLHPEFAPAFDLECEALRYVRQVLGMSNLMIMVPFCRSQREAQAVVNHLARNGLVRGENGLRLYLMCELPVNVISLEHFAEYFDGFSIGSNDLTQLVLGVDRDSEKVAHAFDERDPAVLEMMRMAIEKAHAADRTIGICGQGPSDYPELAEFLVRSGIDSMSLNPDAVLAIQSQIVDIEESCK